MKITLYKTTIKSKDKITIFRKCKVFSEKKKRAIKLHLESLIPFLLKILVIDQVCHLFPQGATWFHPEKGG